MLAVREGSGRLDSVSLRAIPRSAPVTSPSRHPLHPAGDQRGQRRHDGRAPGAADQDQREQENRPENDRGADVDTEGQQPVPPGGIDELG
jgi:hypothetical protein